MLNKISYKATNFLLSKKYIDKNLFAVYEYGFQILFSTLFGTVSITLLSIFLFNIWYALIFCAFFMPLRTFTGGYHCKTYGGCFAVSNLYFVLTVMVSKYIEQVAVNPFVWIFASAPFLLLYVFFRAPVVSKNNTVIKSAFKRGKKYSKLILVLELLVVCFLAYKTRTYAIFAYATICLDVALMLVTEGCNKILNRNI